MCTCIDGWNIELESINNNTRVDFDIWTRVTKVDPDLYRKKKKTVVIGTKKAVQGKTPKIKLIPEYCPFCGEKYQYE
jgi:hypothetical protein